MIKYIERLSKTTTYIYIGSFKAYFMEQKNEILLRYNHAKEVFI